MWADPTVVRHIGGRPFTAEEVWSRLLRYAGHWTWFGFGYWAVEDRETGEFAGELGFADFRRDMKPPLEGTPELGWVLATRFHGRGLATEAVRAAIVWGDANLPSPVTACLIDPDNAGSIRVADKCGYKQENGPASYRGGSVLLFQRAATVKER